MANAFFEGPQKEKLSKPFLCYLRERESFCMAGIYDTWINKETGEVTQSFAIITTVSNALMQQIGHHRSPVILHKDDQQKWLNTADLAEVTALLKPYPAELMNAYPVSDSIKNQANNHPDFLQPTGNRLLTETEQVLTFEEFYWNKNKRALRKE